MLRNIDKFWPAMTVPSRKHLIGNGFIFQQDNDLKHTALKVKCYLERKE